MHEPYVKACILSWGLALVADLSMIQDMPVCSQHCWKVHLEGERTGIPQWQGSVSLSSLLGVHDNLVTSLSKARTGFERFT